MRKKRQGPDDAFGVARAVATLLRLANSDLKDSGLLSSGRNPGNVPALVKLAFDRLVLAVTATERGWPLPSTDAGLEAVPDANPLKVRLIHAADTQVQFQAPPAVLQDGSAPPLPDREALRAAIATTSALLKDLASQFDVDLLGDGPAGHAGPVRAEPPPRPSPPPGRKAAATPDRAVQPPRAAASAPDDRRRVKRPSVVIGPAKLKPSPPPEPHEIEGRSRVELRAPSNNTASTVFWALMDRWQVADLEALDLVGHAGGLTKRGTRPRFKLAGEEVAIFRGLQEIDAALTSLRLEPRGWLNKPLESAPFGGATPIAYLTRQRLAGVRATLRFVLQQGLQRSVSAGAGGEA